MASICSIEIAASRFLLSPMRACKPDINLTCHSLSEGAVVVIKRPLSERQTRADEADCADALWRFVWRLLTFRTEEYFCLASC